MNRVPVAIHEVGHPGHLAITRQRLQQPQQRVLALIHDRGVEYLGEEPPVLGQLLLEPRDDVPADRHVNIGKRFLDHFAESQPGLKLHLGAERHADDVRHLAAHRRQHELAAHIPINVDLLVVQAGQNLFRDARAVAEIALHRIEDERGRVVGGRDVLHDLAEGVQRPFQFVRVVEVLAAGDPLGFIRPLRQLDHIHRGRGVQTRLLGFLPFRQCSRCFLGRQGAPLGGHAGHDPDQEGVREEVVVHLDVDVLLHDLVPVLPEHRREAGQRQVGRRRHPFRRE